MAQESVTQETAQSGAHEQHKGNLLGPILCWAVVFADIGTSVYYTPGILYQTPGVGSLAGFFVLLTMSVFVLLTLKYAEVTHRFPQGGGVVTVGAQAINPWFGALGGMFILVDYFLTAAISCLSGMQYLSVVIIPLSATVVVRGLGPLQVPILLVTIIILILLGLLNWVGISESARVSLIGAIIAFLSDIAILITVFTHLSLSQFLALFPLMFANHHLAPYTLLTGFAASFLAFSGLESISQLSPVMKQPHKRVAGMALLLVVLTIGITSPLLTMLSTILLPNAAKDPNQAAYIISLLGGKWGGIVLQTEVAISASALLVFASNTAIIGAYHVFLALSRMEFLPEIILRRNKLRGTPHISIALATGIPVIILVAVLGNINLLGDLYAFGLLGAFSLTCLGLDIVRAREWRLANRMSQRPTSERPAPTATPTEDRVDGQAPVTARSTTTPLPTAQEQAALNGHTDGAQSSEAAPPSLQTTQVATPVSEVKGLWFKIDFWLGVLTTTLVILAWSTNLINKPLATAFGGSVTLIGMSIAYLNHQRNRRAGRVTVPVVVTGFDHQVPESILAVLTAKNGHNDAVIRAAVNNAGPQTPLVFLYITEPKPPPPAPSLMEIVDPYLNDKKAKDSFGKAEGMAIRAKIPSRNYIYMQDAPELVSQAWHIIHPHDTVIASKDPENDEQLTDVNPDRIRYEITPDGRVTHLLKSW